MSAPLFVKSGSRYRVAARSEVLEVATAYVAERVRAERPALTSPRLAETFLKQMLAARESEAFALVFLDNRHRAICAEILFTGTVDGSSVHPREVVKRALEVNAAAVILAHNHPSGVAEPSRADEAITTRLRDALALVDIRVIDHLIIGGDSVVSLAERGLV